MKKKGSNQYKTKPKYVLGIKPEAWASVWFIAFVTAISIPLVQPHITSPCPVDGCFVKVVYAKDIEGKTILTKQQIINKSNHPKEITEIWIKESSKGANTDPTALHNVCKSKGLSNEFGFGGMQNMYCYKTFEESVNVVDQWLSKQTAQVLCYYNLGVKTSDCEYVK